MVTDHSVNILLKKLKKNYFFFKCHRLQVPGQRERQEDDQQQHQVRHGQGGEGRVRSTAGGPDQTKEGDGGEGEGSEQRDRQTVGNKL